MASLYKRKKSPFWWIKYRDPESGKLIQESTACRVKNPLETRKANEIRDALTSKERSVRDSPLANERWEKWVPEFLELTYTRSPKTLTAYTGVWKTLYRFLLERHIATPRNLCREHAFDYVTWRQKLGHLNTRNHPVSRNRVIAELKLLSRLMSEAVLRGYVPTNCCARLGLKRDEPREKEAMEDWHIDTIRQEIGRLDARARNAEERALYDAFRCSFEIAIRQGCRMAETCFPLSAVDFKRSRVELLAKGGKRYFAELNPDLVPLLQEWKRQGREWTYKMPAHFELKWWKFFDELRRRHPGRFDRISFHSTRVTVISRLEAAGAPESAVMRLVNHASTSVHRIYRRTSKQELNSYWGAVSAGGAHDRGSDSRGSPDGPPSSVPPSRES